MLKTWQPKYSVTSFGHVHATGGDHSQFVKRSSSLGWVSLPSWTVLGGVPWLPVGSCVDPAGDFGMLHPASSASLFTPPDTNAPGQEPLAEIGAENTVKFNYSCLGGIFLSHHSVSTASYPASLKIHQGGVGSAPH